MPRASSTFRARLRGLVVDLEPVKRDRDFRMIWLGQIVSGLGRQVTVTALPFEMWQLTHSSLSIGLLALVQLVPILIFSLGGGAVADAVDRRRLLIATQVLLATSSLCLALLAVQPSPPVWALYVVAFVAAGVGAVDQPARASAIPRLVPRERLPAAIAVNWLSGQTVSIAGSLLAGVLIFLWGVPAAFTFDVATFAASLVALLLIAPIPPHPDAPRPGLRSIGQGLRFARDRRIVLATLVTDFNAMVFGMPSSLFPQLALTVFNAGPAGYGLLSAAPALGAFLGATLSGWVTRIRRPGRGVVAAVAGWGAAIAAFGLMTASFPLALALLAVAGGADVVSAVLRNSIVQLATPDHLRGRLSSIHTLVVTSGPRFGDAEAAAVAAIAGPQFSVVSGGVLCLAGLFVVVRLFPELMRYEHSPVEPPGAGPAPVVAGSGLLDA
ncbi:MAG: MFS transporter [Candidatus Limnocylindrales bacterium]|jgi:MFS family permease